MELGNNQQTVNPSLMDISENVVPELRSSFLKMESLTENNKATATKIYLSYLIKSRNIRFNSISELRVFIYQLSILVRDDDNAKQHKTKPCDKNKSTSEYESSLHIKQNLHMSQHCRNLVRDYLLSALSETSISQSVSKSKNIDLFLRYSDKALVDVVNNIVTELLSVFLDHSKFSPNLSFFEKIAYFFGFLRGRRIHEKINLMASYYRRRISYADSRRLYIKKLAGYVIGN